MKQQTTLIKVINMLFFIVMIIINYLYSSDIGPISAENKPLIQPAGFTFSIWTLIYIWLFAWLVFSFFKSAPSDELYKSLKYWIPLNFTSNALWILAYTSKHFLLSCFFIASVLITTAFIYFTLRRFAPLSWFTTGVFSIYLGWISIATIVNVFSYINKTFPTIWSMQEQLIITIIALVVVSLFAIYMLVRYQDKLLCLTIVWALIGIALNKASTVLTVFCFIAAAMLIILVLFFTFRKKTST